MSKRFPSLPCLLIVAGPLTVSVIAGATVGAAVLLILGVVLTVTALYYRKRNLYKYV